MSGSNGLLPGGVSLLCEVDQFPSEVVSYLSSCLLAPSKSVLSLDILLPQFSVIMSGSQIPSSGLSPEGYLLFSCFPFCFPPVMLTASVRYVYVRYMYYNTQEAALAILPLTTRAV